MLIFGKTDRIVTLKDAEYTKDIFIGSDNNVIYKEYEVGHMGLLLPKDVGITDDILSNIIKVY